MHEHAVHEIGIPNPIVLVHKIVILVIQQNSEGSENRDDTKHLGKVKEFNGDRAKWPGFSFKFTSYLLALDGQYEQWLTRVAATEDEANLINAALPSEDKAKSLRMYNLLTMLMADDSKAQKIVDELLAGKGYQKYAGATLGSLISRRSNTCRSFFSV